MISSWAVHSWSMKVETLNHQITRFDIRRLLRSVLYFLKKIAELKSRLLPVTSCGKVELLPTQLALLDWRPLNSYGRRGAAMKVQLAEWTRRLPPKEAQSFWWHAYPYGKPRISKKEKEKVCATLGIDRFNPHHLSLVAAWEAIRALFACASCFHDWRPSKTFAGVCQDKAERFWLQINGLHPAS